MLQNLEGVTTVKQSESELDWIKKDKWIFKKLVSFDTRVCLRVCGVRERESDHWATEYF